MNANKDTPFQPGSCFLEIMLEHPDGTKLNEIRVSAVNSKDSLIYSAITDQLGMAYFIYEARFQDDEIVGQNVSAETSTVQAVEEHLSSEKSIALLDLMSFSIHTNTKTMTSQGI